MSPAAQPADGPRRSVPRRATPQRLQPPHGGRPAAPSRLQIVAPCRARRPDGGTHPIHPNTTTARRRRWISATALVARRVNAGRILAGTLTANAADNTTPTTTADRAGPGRLRRGRTGRPVLRPPGPAPCPTIACNTGAGACRRCRSRLVCSCDRPGPPTRGRRRSARRSARCSTRRPCAGCRC